MTSHAALVARGWGKCCIVGCADIEIDARRQVLKTVERRGGQGGRLDHAERHQGRGLRGQLAAGRRRPRAQPVLTELHEAGGQGSACSRCAPTPTRRRTPPRPIAFGAEGIGLFRTEHMFYGEGSDKPLFLLRKMIIEQDSRGAPQGARRALPLREEGHEGDPGGHERLAGHHPPARPAAARVRAARRGQRLAGARRRSSGSWTWPSSTSGPTACARTTRCSGHRGVRLGITYPEITEMQVRAILEAAAELIKAGKKALPEIMIPVTCAIRRARRPEGDRPTASHKEVCAEVRPEEDRLHLYGTMIEIPRAALTADKMAETAEFFSFGTNDLTQMGFGFSPRRHRRVPAATTSRRRRKISARRSVPDDRPGRRRRADPHRHRARPGRPGQDLKVGICGEHGGDRRVR